MSIRLIVDWCRPSWFLHYRIMLYGMGAGAFYGAIKLHGDHAFDHALAFGLSIGVMTVVAILIGDQIIYWFNVLLARYIRAIRANLRQAMEMAGVDPGDLAQTVPPSPIFIAIAIVHTTLTISGAMLFSSVWCTAIMWEIMQFGDAEPLVVWSWIGSSTLAAGMGLGFAQCAYMDLKVERLRQRMLGKVDQQSLSVIAAVEHGQKVVARFTGVRRTISVQT